MRHLLPNEADVSGMIRRVDHAVPALEAALAEATARPACNFVGRRLAGLSANQPAAWPRSNPAWSARSVRLTMSRHTARSIAVRHGGSAACCYAPAISAC